ATSSSVEGRPVMNRRTNHRVTNCGDASEGRTLFRDGSDGETCSLRKPSSLAHLWRMGLRDRRVARARDRLPAGKPDDEWACNREPRVEAGRGPLRPTLSA